MVGIYFKTDRLPVLVLLYGTGAILVLTLAALVLQITVSKFPLPGVRAPRTIVG